MMDLRAFKALDDLLALTDEAQPNELLSPPPSTSSPSQFHRDLPDAQVWQHFNAMNDVINAVRASFMARSTTPVQVGWSAASAVLLPTLRTIVGVKLVRRRLATHLYPVALVGPWGELLFVTDITAVVGAQANNVWVELNAAGLPTGQATIVELSPRATDGTSSTREDICDLLAAGGKRLPDPVLAPYGASYPEATEHWQALVAEHARREAEKSSVPPAAA